MWGWGAGRGYKVFPYRTIAMHLPALCKALGLDKKNRNSCKHKQAIGTLIYIRTIAEKNIPILGSKQTILKNKTQTQIHDGYFCANDTGSPYYIRPDRIDIFVGTHRGGNPYLPPDRQHNALIAGGIKNIVPSDWRLWQKKNQRIWCPQNKIPKDPKYPKPSDCTHDYHVVAAHKRLELYAFIDNDGKPIKCKQL